MFVIVSSKLKQFPDVLNEYFVRLFNKKMLPVLFYYSDENLTS